MYNIQIIDKHTKKPLINIKNVTDVARTLKAYTFEAETVALVFAAQPLKLSLWQRLKNAVKKLYEKLNLR